jgi:carbonic anhydrase
MSTPPGATPPVPSTSASGGPPATATRDPRRALAELLDGNRRFLSRQPIHGHDVTAAAASGSGDQQPHAVVLGCIDSRVPLEAIFDQTFGSICVVRSGAHVLDQAILGSVEFAVLELAVPLVMVLGHERCGAVAATVAAVRSGVRPDGSLAYLVDQITGAVTDVGLSHPDVPGAATRRHIERTVAHLRGQVRLATALRAGTVEVVGAIYDLSTGRVDLTC